MKPSDILSYEHRVIEQVLNCLEIIAQQCQSVKTLDRQSAKDAIEFFRNFADCCHHGKEETHFFPAMEAKGIPREGGPIGVMLFEHDQGRKFVRGMDESIEGAAKGDSAAQKDFDFNAREYINLLREHIQKEDHCLFGIANNVFNEQDQQALLAAFEHVETKEIGQGVHDKYLKIADELAKRYGVPITRGETVLNHGCACGH